MRYLPIANSSAVTNAPRHTSAHRIFTSGRTFEQHAEQHRRDGAAITARSINMTANPGMGTHSLAYSMTPVTPRLTTKDVSIRKPMMSTMPNDSRRTDDVRENAVARGPGLHAPEFVERALHLREHRGRAEEECTDAQYRGHETCLLQPRVPHGFFHGGCGLRSDEIGERDGDLSTRSVFTEHDADDCDDDDHEGRERKQRAECQRGRMLEGIALEPALCGCLEDLEECVRLHHATMITLKLRSGYNLRGRMSARLVRQAAAGL